MTQASPLLSAIELGDPRAAERLLPLVYDELRRLAAQKLAQEKPGQTLQETALVHEAYMRLLGTKDPAAVADDGREADLLALDDALTELERHDPQAARLVKLRYFAGLTADQAAAALGISPTTGDRHWAYARAWLRRAMSSGSAPA